MTKALLAADTLVPVNQDLIDIARKHYRGQHPVFWGRYFGRPRSIENYQAGENAVLSGNNIRFLPIAGQTNRVAGSATEGAEDARANLHAFTDALGIEHTASVGGELLMFLAVEGGKRETPDLSVDYWIGWSGALVEQSRRMLGGRSTVIPAVLGRQNRNATWETIARADELGFPCAGALVSRVIDDACDAPAPSWDAAFTTPAVELPCPVMAWQFAFNCMQFEGGVNFDMLHPDAAITTALLNRLLLPPR